MKEADIKLHRRLIAVLNYLDCDKNKRKFAKGLGVNSQNISNIYNNNTIPKLNLISKIATQYPNQVNYHWLLTGMGKMLDNTVGIEKDGSDYNRTNELEIAYLTELKEKNQLIIALQSDLSKAQQKAIDLLEKNLKQ
ncbi:hypothetical protein [Aureispira anguillae]|uniref:HTH cro/C1-type domain-containing protein n=1 Tax=Aureispira anguillae TaxID=2864201 RepID=A0A916DTY5_9BACT|nr:hypothetical protein [Aureispira anguillae]BDS12891.1 hypothetical protein AsAng_0036160 [Aureispira anguillae]